MPLNKQALMRYLAIDDLLRSPKMYSLSQIIETVSDKLGTKISKRTIQGDIQEMRYSVDLGFEAPIVVNRLKGKFFYKYSDPDYSIRQKLDKATLSQSKENVEYIGCMIKVDDEKLADIICDILDESFMQQGMEQIQPDRFALSTLAVKCQCVEACDMLDLYDQQMANSEDTADALKSAIAMLTRKLASLPKQEQLEEV